MITILALEISDIVKEMCNKDICGAAYGYTQILCDAVHKVEGATWALRRGIWPAKYPDSPTVQWAVESDCNYMWFFELVKSVWKEYSYRYENKVHKCSLMAPKLEPPLNGLGMTASTHTCPPLLVPNRYVQSNISDPWVRAINSTRAYYIQEKPDAKWTGRPIPSWYSTGVASTFVASPEPVTPAVVQNEIMKTLEEAAKLETAKRAARELEQASLKKFLFKRIRS